MWMELLHTILNNFFKNKWKINLCMFIDTILYRGLCNILPWCFFWSTLKFVMPRRLWKLSRHFFSNRVTAISMLNFWLVIDDHIINLILMDTLMLGPYSNTNLSKSVAVRERARQCLWSLHTAIHMQHTGGQMNRSLS